ncbi:MAG: LemA family protein [Pseudomonadota bacterium]
MALTRVIEFGVSFLAAFVVVVTYSTLSLRPALVEVRSQVAAEWSGFVRGVEHRNNILGGLVEGLKGFEPGKTKLASKILEAQAMAVRSTDPDRLAASVDEIERLLTEMESLVASRPELNGYPPFAANWTKTLELTRRINLRRMLYNKNVELYNRLLAPFPQSLMVSLLGFVPLKSYPYTQPFAGQ